MNIRKSTKEDLIAVLDKRVECQTRNDAEIVDLLREVIYRRLWIEFGATSAFEFLTKARYRYAPAVAQRMIDAAKLMEAIPELKDYLLSGDLNLTQIGMLARAVRQKGYVKFDKQREVLKAICGHTVRNTQVILNEMLEIEVKAVEKYRVQRDGSVVAEITFSKEEWEDIQRAKDVVSHSVPNGEVSAVLVYCARFTLAKKDPSVERRPQKPLFTSLAEVMGRQNRWISAASRRFVFQRDGSCRHINPDGSLCGSCYQLQVDHVISVWRGGSNNVENLQLLCGIHNRYKYEQELKPYARVNEEHPPH